MLLHQLLGQIPKVGGCEYTSRAGPSPKVLHPTPTHLPQPVQPRAWARTHSCLAGMFGAGSAPQWVSAGDLPRPVPRQTPSGALLMAETQRVGLPAGITASAGRLGGPATMALLPWPCSLSLCLTPQVGSPSQHLQSQQLPLNQPISFALGALD